MKYIAAANLGLPQTPLTGFEEMVRAGVPLEPEMLKHLDALPQSVTVRILGLDTETVQVPREALYNLEADPGELHPLDDPVTSAAMRSALQAELERVLSGDRPAWTAAPAPIQRKYRKP